MAGTTISGSYTASITLSNPATQNPSTVSSTGHINATSGSALYGANTAAWSIYNFGTLVGPARGIFLTAGGVISNAATGLISGGYRGIDITGAAGTVTNAGSIAGNMLQGVRLTRGGSVTNASGGNISGGGTYAAIYIIRGGTVSNAAGATITGPVQIVGATGTVSNAGSITAAGSSAIAVQLSAGGSVTNTAGGVINGGSFGIYLAAGTVTNFGSIAGGVSLHGAGTITNAAGAVIVGGSRYSTNYYGVTLSNGGSIANAGSILNIGDNGNLSVTNLSGGMISREISDRSGMLNLQNAGVIAGEIHLIQGGTINNQAGGTLTGIYATGATTLVNYGSIGFFGVNLLAGGSIRNAVGGLIGTYEKYRSYQALKFGTPSTLTNAGTIFGTVYGTYDGYGGNSPVAVANISGATIVGNVVGQGVTLTNAGLIKGRVDSEVVSNAAGGTITNAFGYAIRAMSTVINDGMVVGTIGVFARPPIPERSPITIINAGTIIGTGGTAVSFYRNYTGLLVIEPGAKFIGRLDGGTSMSAIEFAPGSSGRLAGFGSSIVNFDSITFDPGAAWTIAGNTSGLNGVISGFAQQDTIDLIGLTETIELYSAGTLTLTGDQTVELNLPGAFTTASFLTAPDAGIGTDIFLACFVAGTRIATDAGEVPVEDLRVGDYALTLGGNGTLVPRPIRWIGRRRIDLARHPRPRTARPIRIRRNAFDDNVPDCDLLLSPDHAIYAEGVLIPVRHLVNDCIVAAAKRLRHVEYFHIELDQHAILLANGMPVESYLDTGDRSSFENGGVAVTLYPDFASRTWEAGGCARLMVTGPEVVAVRRQLKRRADQLLSARPARSMRR